FDFLFMVSLVNLLALASVQAASRSITQNSVMAKIGSVLAWGQWLAGILWISQNLVLVTMLTGEVTSPRPEIVYWCGAIKFSLLGLALVYVLVMRLRRK